ncbi:MAG: uracil-DNA glycosylase, family 1, partial [Bacteroidota bacterium]
MSTFLSTINCFGWEDFFEEQKTHSYWESLNQKVEHAYRTSRCFPESKAIFRAFEGTPAAEVKCIIMGQDPYHGPGQAMGLSFSVPPSVSKLPPSLRNIFNEYEQDLGLQTPRNGDLTEWAKNGVLLLNTILSVEESKPGSHHNLGWQELTKNAVRFVLEQNPGVGFLCFGAPAQKLTE